MNAPRVEPLRPVITAEQIQKRVKELGRQISDDYQGETVQMLAVLETAAHLDLLVIQGRLRAQVSDGVTRYGAR